MPTIHFLNVNDGDCTVIEHISGHVTLIDVSNARPTERLVEAAMTKLAAIERGVNGNFQQKKYPVNPISYLKARGITSIFRYVQTHPDMDHMDGISDLFAEFKPLNFWDTANTKDMDPDSWDRSPYRKEDWEFYVALRDGDPNEDPRRLTLLSGARGQFFNVGSNGSGGGDGLRILAPTKELVEAANEADEFNDCSFVLLYKTGKHRIVFAGDSHDATWEHILENYAEDVTDIDLLVAPHHGRDSDRSYDFLDTLNPTLTLFGVAPSKDLAYPAWNNRGLPFITNNQANCVVIDAGASPMDVYVTHEHFARAKNRHTWYSEDFKAWYVGPIER